MPKWPKSAFTTVVFVSDDISKTVGDTSKFTSND